MSNQPSLSPDSSRAEPLLVRAVAIGNRLDVGAAATEERFVAELERIVSLASEHLSDKQPNLIVLGELLGLPAGLAGPRGWPARHASTARSALALLAAAYAPRVLYYRHRWPGTPLARALLLALTDALYRPFVH